MQFRKCSSVVEKAKGADDVSKSGTSEEQKQGGKDGVATSSASTSSASTAPFDVPKEVDHSVGDDGKKLTSDAVESGSMEQAMKKTDSENVLDKMESSMEKKPSVFMYEDATVASFN